MYSYVNCKQDKKQPVQLAQSNTFKSASAVVLLSIQTDVEYLQASRDVVDGLDEFVSMAPSAAPASLNFIAGSTCHVGQMPHIALCLSPCQQSPESSSGTTGGVGRSHSAPQLGKSKGAIDCCNYKGNVQTCRLQKAQANFRKSLRRGFVSTGSPRKW